MTTSATPDVVDELTADHRAALDLLDQIESSTDPDERRGLARDALPDGEEEVRHDVEEHAELEGIMKRLESADSRDPGFDGLVTEMTEALRHHARTEETEQFPKLRARLTPERLVELRDEVQKAKQVAPTRPHPQAPNSELFHKMVGPGVGLVDRLRTGSPAGAPTEPGGRRTRDRCGTVPQPPAPPATHRQQASVTTRTAPRWSSARHITASSHGGRSGTGRHTTSSRR